MAKNKFYAVKCGRKTGIFKTWDECKKQVDGYSGASYKSFVTKEQAEAFLSLDPISDKTTGKQSASKAVAYVDGSYSKTSNEFSYGIVMFYNGKEKHFAEKLSTSSLLKMKNVAGEITGAKKAMQFCIANGITSLDIYYDYLGIANWCTGEWEAHKPETKAYKKFYDSIKENLKVNFYKVTAHSGNKYNNLADKLAKSALNI